MAFRKKTAENLRASFSSRVRKTVFLTYLSFFVTACGTLAVTEHKYSSSNLNRSVLTLNETDPLPADRNLHADHYPASNERRLDLFRSRVEGLGGGYIGVGTDQNLTLVAWAKSEYAFLADFDPITVAINRIHLYFLEISPTYAEFEALWDAKNKKETLVVLEKRFSSDPEFKVIGKAYEIALKKGGVPQRLGDLKKISKAFDFKSFHNDPNDYDYLRNMVLEGRILAVDGNLLGTKTFRAIGEKATKIHIPIRILYTSNAEEYFRYPDDMRKNFLGLPTDEKSILIRTVTKGAKVYGFPDGEMFPKDYPFHYNIQSMDNFKIWLNKPGALSTTAILSKRKQIVKGLSVVEGTPTDESKKTAQK
ncbi:putative lipoprotein [Leptospira inadai serovar Lyme str. 10]|uniref:DUF7790 domain-containing protein n=2 Tax=Leptospira inadai serovar Lyme TaxID=293084 RepID=A0ABX4YF71_9LEPT|nr:hypothetical protein [Leptospira inadai]EQA35528.1 putative lipoprotein [Leptospira inadai serovar Lyme str. 10]PNV73679.1 hypothetical protein BES34_016665 [Leptospira inadai serovar Lyme]